MNEYKRYESARKPDVKPACHITEHETRGSDGVYADRAQRVRYIAGSLGAENVRPV